MPVDTIQWKNRELIIIDQTLLPGEYREIRLRTQEEVWTAIKTLQVRGAPAIGVCAGLGVVVGVNEAPRGTAHEVAAAALSTAAHLATSRPTAVNLFWALDRMKAVAQSIPASASANEALAQLEEEAVLILEEDKRLCRAIGEEGASLIQPGDGVLTHCNAGGLATADYGTALAPMFRAHEQGKTFAVFADETRPLLQGSRLTAWELQRAGIDVTLICDNMAAQVMSEGKIQRVLVGADRVAANGDVANKIGTYSLAVLAKAHDIPFYVAAPISTIDTTLPTGETIPIEIRAADEVTHGFGPATAPAGINVYNPAFDVTPNALIAGIVTERGILRAPYTESIAAAFTHSN